MDQFSPVTHSFYSPAITPNMPLSLGLTSGFSLQSARTLSKQPFIIGICGGSCSGKSQVTEKLKLSLDFSATVINEFDFYFPDMTSEDNFDNPDCIDWVSFKNCLESLNNKKTFECPQYDMLNHKQKKTVKVFPTPVIIVEGLFVFLKEEIRRNFDLKIYIECPDDVRLGNRVRKFTKEMGMSMEFVIDYYLKYTKVSYERFIETSKVYADIVIPNYGTQYQSKGIDFMVYNITQTLYGEMPGCENINRLRYAPLKFTG